MATSRLTGLLLGSASNLMSTVAFAPDGGGAKGASGQSLRYAVLEQRMLFDAAGAASFADAQDHAIDVDHADLHADGSHSDLMAALAVAVVLDPVLAPEPASSSVVFINSQVDDIDALISQIDPQADVYILSADRDGLDQIADILQGRSDVGSLHIISHGSAGVLELGSTQMTLQSMSGAHAEDLAVIAASLSRDADIMIYGCDFAAGVLGHEAVNLLSALTGADVAASDDLTGAASLGGDWLLEVQEGQVETGALRFNGWDHELSITNTGNWTVAGNVATNTTGGVTTTITFAPTAGGSNVLNATPQTFNPTAGFFVNAADGDPSLGFTYTWDTTPDAAVGVPQPDASTDDATMTVTITFSQAITNPVINIDRLGGNGTYDPNTAVAGDEDSRSNSSSWMVTTPGATLTKLTGVNHLDVTSTTFQRTPNAVMATSGISGEASVNASNSTAAGSIRVNGTFTTLTFLVSGVGVEGAAADGIEIGLIVDPPPNANNDSFTLNEDSTLTGSLFANNGAGLDADPQGDTITVTQINGAAFTVGTPIVLANGTLTITNATTGAFTFAPNSNFAGGAAFNYTISDPNGGSDTASVSVAINGVNDAPAGTDATFTTLEDTPFVFASSNFGFTDPLDAPVNAFQSVTITSLPSSGTLLLSGSPVVAGQVITVANIPNLTWTPPLNGNGAGLASLTFKVTDNGGLANGGVNTDQSANTLTFDVTAVNDSPVDGNEINTTAEDVTLTVTAASGLLANSTDVDGGVPTITGYSVTGVAGVPTIGATFTIPGKGDITINANGSYTFIPFANFNGTVPQITYTVSDGAGGSDTSTLDLTVTPVNDAPVDGNETNTTLEDTTLTVTAGAGLLANTTDVDGGTPTITGFSVSGVVGTPVIGTAFSISGKGNITINADGSYTFVPAANFSGTVPQITYTVSDGAGGTVASTLDFTVTPVNDTPVDGNETNTTLEDNTLTVTEAAGLLANTTDVDGGTLTITGFSVSGVVGITVIGTPFTIPGKGDITINTDGSYTFVPSSNFSGTVPQITYTVSDGADGTASTLDLTVSPVNDAPVDSDETNSTLEDTPLIVLAATGLLANTVDPDGLTPTIAGFTVAGVVGTPVIGTAFTIPDKGDITINADGSYNFTPVLNYNGPIPQITYTVSDGAGGTDTSTLDLSVTAVNDAPLIDLNSAATTADTTRGNAVTFTEGDTPINVALISGDVNEFGENDITKLTIVVAGNLDGTNEKVVIAGVTFDLATTTAPQAGIVGGTNVSITYDATTKTFTIINAAGTTVPMAQADLDALVRGVTYENASQAPSAGARTLTFTATDSGNLTSPSAVATITVVPVNDQPLIDLNGPATSGDSDVNTAVTFTEGDTPIMVATLVADVNDITENDITTLTIVAGSNPDGTAEKIVIAGKTFDLATTAIQTATVGGTTVSIAYDATTKTFTITNDAGATTPMAQADLDAIIQGVTYENISQNPTAGSRTLTFAATDASNLTSLPAMATITVVAVNDAPVDASEIVAVNEDTTLTVPAATGLLSNLVDPDGGTPVITSFSVAGVAGTPVLGTAFTVPGRGDITIHADGSYEFVPVANYNGPVPQITYSISDGAGGTDISTLDLSVTSVNDAPLLDLNSAATVLDTAVDNAVTFTEGDAPIKVGTLAADVNDIGENDITKLTIVAGSDPDGAAEKIVIAGQAFNLAITAGPVAATVGSTNVFISYDASTKTFSVTNAGGPTVPMAQADLDALIREVTYENTSDNPTVGDRTLVFTAIDAGNLSSLPATATITIANVNDGPVDGDEVVTATEDVALVVPAATGLLANTIDPDGAPAMITGFIVAGVAGTPVIGTVFTIPGKGDITINADGSYEFVPAPDYFGTVPEITYTVDDGAGGTDTSTLTLSVTAVNDAPLIDLNSGATVADTLRDNAVTFSEADAPVPVTTLLADVNELGENDVTTLTIVAGANPDGTAEKVVIAGQTFDLATTAGPVATTVGGTNVLISYDATTKAFSVVNAIGPTVPMAQADLDALIRGVTYQNTSENPTAGDQTLTFTVTDAAGLSSLPAVATITVVAVNDAPVDDDEVVVVTEDVALVTPAATGLLANLTDVDGGIAAVTGFTVPGLVGSQPVGVPVTISGVGEITINSDGSYTFAPSSNYVGPVPVITYTVDDGAGGVDTSTLSLSITPVNDAPVVVDPANPGTPLNPIEATDSQNIIPDVTSTDGGSPAPINAGQYFVDPEGDALTFTATDLPPGLSIAPDGTISGMVSPSASQGSSPGQPVGTYLVTITADDGNGHPVTTTVTYTISNPPPVAVDDVAAVTEDVAATGNVLTDPVTGDADTAPDSDPLTVVSFDIPGVGTTPAGSTATIPGVGDLQINADGSWTFTPAPNYNGPVPVATYTISDGNGGTDTGNLTLTITPVNDAPVVVDPSSPGTPENPIPATDPNNIIPDVTTTDGATPVDPNVSQFFADPEGDALTFTASDLPPGLSMLPDGTITGTIDPSASQGSSPGQPVGTYLVTVTADDGNDHPVTTTVTYTISNPPPVAADDAANVSEDAASVFGNVITAVGPGDVADVDTAPDSDPLTVVSAMQGANPISIGVPFTTAGGGILTLNADGSYTFAPGTAYNGLDDTETAVETISYTIDDGNGGTDVAVLVITVTGANDAPVVVDPDNPGTPDNPIPVDPDTIVPVQNVIDGQAFPPGSPLVDLAPFIVDPDADPVTFSTTSTLPPGLTLNPDGTVTGTIDPSASQGGDPGNPGVYTITVLVSDGTTTTPMTLTIDVSNLAPVAVDDGATVTEDVPANGNVLTDPVTGDADTAPDADPLTVVSFDIAGVGTTLAGSTATIPGVGDLTITADGSYTFTPAPNYDGPVPVATYLISDGNGGTDTGTLTLTITPVNDAPVVVDPANPGTPLNPIAVPDPLNIIPDLTTTDGATPVDPNVAQYFVDPEGDALTFTAADLPPGLVIAPDGTISGTIDPAASQGSSPGQPVGTYLVTITADDGNGHPVTTTVTYTITNPPPVAVDDTATVTEDVPSAGNVLTDGTPDHDTAPDSDPLTVVSFDIPGVGSTPAGSTATIPGVGTLLINADGSYIFTPAPNYDGPVPVATYTISDGNGGIDTGTLTLLITPVNDAPVVVDPANPGTPLNPIPAGDPNNIIPDVTTTDGGSPALINAGQFFVDPEGDALTFTATDLPPGLSIAPDGTISGTIDPAASQGSSPGQPVGTYLVTIMADDGNGHPVTTTVTYTIANLAPVAVDDHATGGTEDVPQSGNVLTDPVTGDHDAGPDSDLLMVTGVLGGTVGIPLTLTYGALTLNPNGSWSFTPNALANSLPAGALVQQTVSYTVSDGNGGTATATLTIDVNGVNDAPVVLAAVPPQDGLEGHPVSVDVSSLFDDVDTGDVLTFAATGLPPGLSIDPVTGLISGTIAFNAAAGGPYSVTVQVSDGHGGTATTTFVWDVKAETVADTPKPNSPLVLPSLEKTVDLGSRHPVLDTVNGLAPLRGTPNFEDLIITRTIDDLSSLNSAIDIEPGDGMIGRLVEWAGRQGRQASWIYGLFEKMNREPYAGDSLDLVLGLDGTDLFGIKTVLHNGALYIGVDELTDAGDVVDISVVAGGGGVARMGAQDVIVNVLPGDGWIDLKIAGQTKDGRRVTWAVTVNAHSGEVLGVKTEAGLPKLANVILRGDAGHAPPIVSGFGAPG